MPISTMIIALVAIIGGLAYAAYEQHVKLQIRTGRNKRDETTEKTIEELKTRIEVLEKLVTDDKYQLKQEIDKLKQAS